MYHIFETINRKETDVAIPCSVNSLSGHDNCGTTVAEINYIGAETAYVPNQSSTTQDVDNAVWKHVPRSSVLHLRMEGVLVAAGGYDRSVSDA